MQNNDNIPVSRKQKSLFSEEAVYAKIQTLLPEPVTLVGSDNLLEFGLDSLKIMRLASEWRRMGASVSFAKLIEAPSLDVWMQLLVNNETDMEQTKCPCAAEDIEPVQQNMPFPLTDVQYAYWVGRRDGQPLGGVGCHAYLEFDAVAIDVGRLQNAWTLLVAHHPMLRMRFLEEGIQEVLPNGHDLLVIHDHQSSTQEEVKAHLEDLRSRLSHRRFDVANGHVASVALSLLPEKKARIHFDIDLLVADVQSLHILLRDLAASYSRGVAPVAPKNWNFAQYLMQRKAEQSDKIEQDRQYWQSRLSTMPSAPELPLTQQPEACGVPTFKRHEMRLQPEVWQSLKIKAKRFQTTPAMVLLTMYATVLARWSMSTQFNINIPIFNRLSGLKGLEDVVADFTDVLLLEVDFSVPRSFRDQLFEIKTQFQKDVGHTAYSGVQVQRDMARQRHGERMLAPVVFACNLGTPLLTEEFKTSFGNLQYMISQTPQVWLDFQIYETDDTLLLAWDAVEELFPDGMIDTMLGSYGRMASWLAEDDNDWSSSFDLMPVPQVRRRNEDIQAVQEPQGQCLHTPFFEYAALHPNQIALRSCDAKEGQMSYAELALSALRLAAYLREQGLQSQEPVAIVLPRGASQIVAVLGVLAAGGFYIPINAAQPEVRRDRICEKAGVKFIITDTQSLSANWPVKSRVVAFETAMHSEPLSSPIEVDPTDSAYVIFTSGSTGEPKGVEVCHTAAWNTVEAINSQYDVSEKDVILAVSSIDFDLSVYDIFGLLAVGGSIVVLDEANRRDAALWLELIETYSVSLWNSVPTLLEMLLVAVEGAGRLSLPLRQVMLSGDWIALDLPSRLAIVAPTCGFVGMGGATEAAIWSNYQPVTFPIAKNWSSIPYGRPLPNQVYRVVNALGEDCPDWVAGELWIGGAGIAKGYRGDHELTTRHFIESGGLRWYRTGDMGRFWPDGTIEFLGRQDSQVKIRGHRIEMGEIESVLSTHPDVSAALVAVVESAQERHRLVAHVVASPQASQDVLASILTQYLETRVPEYMVPTLWNIVTEFPLTANGKIDRRALTADMSVSLDSMEISVAPGTQSEKSVARLWAEVLNREDFGIDASFFELGGDSLLGTQVVARIRQTMNIPLPLETLFSSPTVRALAHEIDLMLGQESGNNQMQSETANLPRVIPDLASLHEPFPLTEIQNAYWVGRSRDLELGNVATIFYYELDNEGLDIKALNAAWNRVIERHPMLRAVILQNGMQQVLRDVPEFVFPVSDFSSLSKNEQSQALDSVREEIVSRVMPADKWPLFDIRVSLLAKGKVRLHVAFDCLIVDAWSLLILIQDWYRFFVNPESSRSKIDLSFRDYVIAEQVITQTDHYEKDRDYWMQRIDSLPHAPNLPLAIDPATIDSPRFQRREYCLKSSLWTVLKDRASRFGLTPSGVLAAVYAEILKQWSRSPVLTLNLTLFNRLPVHDQVHDIVGDFTSLTLLAVTNESGSTFISRAEMLQKQLFRDLDHRSYNGAEFLREIARRRGEFSKAAMPVVFTSALNMGSLGNDSGFGLLGEMGYSVSQTPQVWLDCQVYESDGNAILTWDAVDGLFPEGMIDAMFAAFTSQIESLAESEFAWHESVPAFLPEEQRSNRRAVNATDKPVSSELLHTLVFAQAARTPSALAVIAPNKTLTYQELADFSGTLGLLLRDEKIRSNQLVAIVMDKGWEQVVAALGILAAGAAYLPIDPSLPTKRLHHLLADAKISMVLTQTHLQEMLVWPDDLDCICVDTVTPQKGATVSSPQTPDDLAYVIYTSGSTGTPKGVMIDHRGAVNTILDVNTRFGIGPNDRAIALSNLNFDLSVYDIFGMLSVGGAVVLPHAAYAKDPSHWLELIEKHGVSLWNSVPMMMQMLTEYTDSREVTKTYPLKTVLLSGDWIPLDLPDAIRHISPHARIVGLGGATEASIWSNTFEIDAIASDWSSIPYGKPMTNQRYHVLDDAFRDVPDWVPGNLYIAGVGLSKGYWGDPIKTNASFVTHPMTGEHLYRTGDMGRYLPDGNIEFLGREDTQVKVGGHRIELGEIQSVLERHPRVSRAVALTEGEPLALAAVVVVAQEDRDSIDFEKKLVAYLEDLLPNYMIPRKIMMLESLPLNSNGKVDVKALQVAVTGYRSLSCQADVEAPKGEFENRLAAVWSHHLETTDISRHDDFFHLGGDSLKATRIIRELYELKIVPEEVSLRTFFAAPTIARFAAQVKILVQKKNGAESPQQNNYEEGVL